MMTKETEKRKKKRVTSRGNPMHHLGLRFLDRANGISINEQMLNTRICDGCALTGRRRKSKKKKIFPQFRIDEVEEDERGVEVRSGYIFLKKCDDDSSSLFNFLSFASNGRKTHNTPSPSPSPSPYIMHDTEVNCYEGGRAADDVSGSYCYRPTFLSRNFAPHERPNPYAEATSSTTLKAASRRCYVQTDRHYVK